jgi:signal transduction histidine kinase
MTQRQTSAESAALKVYQKYWESYLKGDLEAFSSTIDDRFEMIGTSESEVCHSKADGIAFYKAQMAEVMGKVEMRNSQITSVWLDPLVLVNEACDIYVKTGEGWSFYSKLRLSTLLRETSEGWKVVQQHGSLPDMRAGEGETIAIEKISKENLELRDAIKRRTIELENKNRELAIEASLEKVRAVAMGMKKPEDMLDVCRAISDQLQQFGVEKIRNVQTAIIDENIGQYLCYQYFSPYDKTTIEKTEYLKSPVEHGMVRQMLTSRDGYFIGRLSDKDLEDFRSHRKEENHFPDPLLDEAIALDYCFLSIGEGGLGLTVYQKMNDEVLTLFRRFHQVFSLAYQRFRDIQKAEAQAREARLEAALERVRARTMSMQKSEELGEVATVLFSELNSLVDDLWTCGFVLCEKNRSEDEWWLSLANGLIQPFFLPNVGDFTHRTLYEGWGNGEAYRTVTLENEMLQEHYDWLMNIPIARQIFEDMEGSGIPRPNWQRLHAAYFKTGYLVVITEIPCAEEEVFKRFAQVFDLTYTRFLDLKKAEAQAREAEIQLALERVRARSLAMHHTSELQEVVNIAAQQLHGIGMDINGGIFICINAEIHEDLSIWASGGMADYVQKVVAPVLDKPIFTQIRDAIRKGNSFLIERFSDNEKMEMFAHLFQYEPWKSMPTERKEELMSRKGGFARSVVSSHHTSISITNHHGKAFSDDENEILKRFGKVFEQSYTRFLDLQKAEAQAREAKIEAALEKVRSRSLAMHKSEEQKEVVAILFEKLQQLEFGIDKGAASLVTFSEDSKEQIRWIADAGEAYAVPFLVPYTDHLLSRDIFEAKKSGTKYLSKQYSPKEKNDYFNYLFQDTDYKTVPKHVQEMILSSKEYAISAAFEKRTAIFVTNTEGKTFSEMQMSILKRFSNVFEQTYTRFLDLQKAEAQAREAQIEASLERTRTQSMLMQHSDEIKSISNIFHEQLLLLDIPSEFSYVWLPDEASQSHQFWASWSEIQDGQVSPSSKQVTYPLDKSEPYTAACYAAWANPEVILEEFIPPSDIAGFFEVWQELLAGATKLKADFFPEGIYYSEAYMRFGCFGINIRRKLSEEEKHILKRFSKEFERAYTRFLDLQKAEAQAREAQIEAALEKVRSRSLAMHKADELLQVATVMRSEMAALGVEELETSSIYTMLDHDAAECWYAIKDVRGQDSSLVFDEMTIDLKATHVGREMLDFFQSKAPQTSILMKGEQRREWINYCASCSKVLKGYYGSEIPERTYHLVKFSHGYVGAATPGNISRESWSLLQRMTAVFSLAYTRFLDLQKAEAQAREAQIEAALERVRAKAMAMHTSNELREVVRELRRQMGILGQKNLETCVIHLHDESLDFVQSWAGIKPPDEEGDILESIANVPKKGLRIIEEALYAYNSNLQDYVLLNEGEKLRQWFSFLEKEAPEGFARLVDSVHGNIEELQSYWSFADFAGGSLLMVTRDEPDELTRGLLRRFSNVFGLAYRRFADLKIAEAQAREAQIEAALERVRSRSMAMNKSEELKEVIQIVYEQIVQLKIPTEHAGFIMDYKRRDDFDSWIADQFGSPSQLTIPYFDCIYYNRFNEAKAKGEDFFTTILSFEEKNQFYEDLFEHIPGFPEESKNIIFSHPGFTISTVLLENVALYIENFTCIPFSEEENGILMRFGKVFQQTYTRFLDLQKAEAQAREAQIEAALERVRSRTMAMQSSEELADAAYVLFEQLNFLGVTHERINIGIVDEEKNCIDFWVTEQGGQKLQTKFSGRISEPTTLAKSYEAWKNEAKSLVVDLQGEELQSWLKYMEEEIKIPFNKAYLHNRRVQTAGFFSKGMLVVTSPEPLQNEALYLLEKFAGVFDLTYTRFSDLKLAEAQALQAEKDLVEIKIARQKAEEALAELKSTQTQLIQQEKLASLGQLTAGIAHEIKNPLNFVNNFSEVSIEMIGEILEARSERREVRNKNQEPRDKNEEVERDESEVLEEEILEDIKANLEKIHEHGSRANGIVTSMLQHSRGGSGKKEHTDLNALIKEYVNLSFHGMRAGKNPIDVEIALDLDEAVKEIPLVREDFTRVIINLCNNSFDAMRQKFNSELTIHNSELYIPKLTVRTKSEKDHILIEVADNGPGIPDEIKDKILQPFFTTKKGTEGTGLGLSITHDIVKAHGGELSVETRLGGGINPGKTGAIFIISLPLA